MYALVDQPPRFCPRCGAAWDWPDTLSEDGEWSGALGRFYHYGSCGCPSRCGLRLQYIPLQSLLEAAAVAGGDLHLPAPT